MGLRHDTTAHSIHILIRGRTNCLSRKEISEFLLEHEAVEASKDWSNQVLQVLGLTAKPGRKLDQTITPRLHRCEEVECTGLQANSQGNKWFPDRERGT